MHFNIPVFIPHLGCPFQCIFCNQKHISGILKAPEADDIVKIIEQKLSTIDYKTSDVEVAFFGGSFTCLPKAVQENYLGAVQPYITEKKIHGIRISTRPDFITPEILHFLMKYRVKAIELGAQSMDDGILAAIGRGHTTTDVIRSSHLIKEHGFELGLQTMVGLPGEKINNVTNTAKKVAKLKPDTVRIYPVLVIKNTELEKMYNQGTYQPLSLESAVDFVMAAMEVYNEKDINVIKVGLHPSEELQSGKSLVAGPFHPSFRELVLTKMWALRLEKLMIPEKKPMNKKRCLTITVPFSEYNNAIGYKAANRKKLSEKYAKVRFLRSETLKKMNFEVDYH